MAGKSKAKAKPAPKEPASSQVSRSILHPSVLRAHLLPFVFDREAQDQRMREFTTSPSTRFLNCRLNRSWGGSTVSFRSRRSSPKSKVDPLHLLLLPFLLDLQQRSLKAHLYFFSYMVQPTSSDDKGNESRMLWPRCRKRRLPS